MADADAEAQDRLVADVEQYLSSQPPGQLPPDDANLAAAVARTLMQSGQQEPAARAYRQFAQSLRRSNNELLLHRAAVWEGRARRATLVGTRLRLEGSLSTGRQLDPSEYANRPLLVLFNNRSFDGSRAAAARLALIDRWYRDRQLKSLIVAVDGEVEAEQLQPQEQPVALPVLIDRDDSGGHPTADYYGITQFPTFVLADRNSTVIAVSKNGTDVETKLGELIGPPLAPRGPLICLDLSSVANAKLTGEIKPDEPENNLAELPRGEQTFCGVRFSVSDALIALGGQELPGCPKRANGIPVRRTFRTLYLPHATQWGTGPGPVADGTVIGHIHLHYDDGTQAQIPIVYGDDVRNWWNDDQSKPVRRGLLAWTGHNPKADPQTIRLYVSAYENPHRDKSVTTLDYSSTCTTAAAPFCVAMTAETSAAQKDDR